MRSEYAVRALVGAISAVLALPTPAGAGPVQPIFLAPATAPAATESSNPTITSPKKPAAVSAPRPAVVQPPNAAIVPQVPRSVVAPLPAMRAVVVPTPPMSAPAMPSVTPQAASPTYTFAPTAYGTVQVLQNGRIITTTTPQSATQNYGYQIPRAQQSVQPASPPSPVVSSSSPAPAVKPTASQVPSLATSPGPSTSAPTPQASTSIFTAAPPIAVQSTPLHAPSPPPQAASPIYTFVPTAYGTVQVSQNGKIIATATPQLAAQQYGYQIPGAQQPVQPVPLVSPVVSSSSPAPAVKPTASQVPSLATSPGPSTSAPTPQASTSIFTAAPPIAVQPTPLHAPSPLPISRSGPNATAATTTPPFGVLNNLRLTSPGQGSQDVNLNFGSPVAGFVAISIPRSSQGNTIPKPLVQAGEWVVNNHEDISNAVTTINLGVQGVEKLLTSPTWKASVTAFARNMDRTASGVSAVSSGYGAVEAYKAHDPLGAAINAASAAGSASSALGSSIPLAASISSMAGSAQAFGTALGAGDKWNLDKKLAVGSAGLELAGKGAAIAAGYLFGGSRGADAAADVADMALWGLNSAGDKLTNTQLFKRATDRWLHTKTNEDRAAAFTREFEALRAERVARQ